MRLLITLASLAGLAVVSRAQVVKGVYELTKDLKGDPPPVAASSVIDTDSGLRVVIDAAEARRKWREKYPATKLEVLLTKVENLEEVSKTGLSKISELVIVLKRFNGQPDVVALSRALRPLALGALDVIEMARIDPELHRRLNDALETAGSMSAQYRAIFEVSAKYAAELRTQIPGAVAESEIKVVADLRLLRNLNPSRERDVPAFSPLSQAQIDFSKDLESATNEFAEQFKSLRLELANTIPKAAQAASDQFLTSVKTLDLKAKAIVAPLASSKVEPLKAHAVKIQASLNTLSASAEEVEGMKAEFDFSGGNPESFLLSLSPKLSRLEKLFKDSDTAVSDLQSTLRSIKIDLAADPQLELSIREALAQLETSLKEESGKIIEAALGASENLAKIVEALKPLTALDIEFREIGKQVVEATIGTTGDVNIDLSPGILADGTTIGFKPGDRLPLILNAQQGTRKEELYRQQFYSYPMRVYFDRVVFLSFVEAEDKKSWRPGAAYGWIRKEGTRKSLAANELQSIGYGLSVFALDQNRDDAIELGLAPTLSLFDDFLLFGGGFNLTRNRWFGFVGLRIPVRF